MKHALTLLVGCVPIIVITMMLGSGSRLAGLAVGIFFASLISFYTPPGTGNTEDDFWERALFKLISLMIVLRLLLGFFLLQSGISTFLAPDSGGYFTGAMEVVGYYRGELQEFQVNPNAFTHFYTILSASLYYFIDPEPFLPAIINCFLGGGVVYCVYYQGLELGYSRQKAFWGATLVGLWPSMMLWSCLNIRDAWMHFTLCLCVLLWTRVLRTKRFTPPVFLCMVVSGVMIYQIRIYILPIMIIAMLVALYANRATYKRPALILMTCLLLVALQMDSYLGFSVLEILQQLQSIRAGFARADVGSSFAIGVTYNSLFDVVLFLPTALVYFFFAPFPWTLTSALQSTTLVEVLVFYLLFIPIVKGWNRSFREHFSAAVTPFMLMVFVAVAYSLAEGNVGTLYRHKAQILPMILVFAPAGIRGFRLWGQHYLADEIKRAG